MQRHAFLIFVNDTLKQLALSPPITIPRHPKDRTLDPYNGKFWWNVKQKKKIHPSWEMNLCYSVAYPGIFFGGGFNKFS